MGKTRRKFQNRVNIEADNGFVRISATWSQAECNIRLAATATTLELSHEATGGSVEWTFNSVSRETNQAISLVAEGYGRRGEEEEEISNEDICILVDIKKDQKQDSLKEILKIGVACSREQPRERMKLSDIIKEWQLVLGLLIGSAIE
ncbi:hypothetical protein Goari_022119 [Gossypium aridum]|uniref:Uncharacterized protein n=1 Tax=Gossypium aridum TaxID=34290 RepID=A0A7J8YUX8_GOSAI|nr:hypothetical protein [Gossypium aridum]